MNSSSMASPNPQNVYFGADSMIQYYDPDQQPPLPLVEIPAKLNPFREDGVRIYAKMMCALPANNVKSLPALNMLQSSKVTDKTKTVIEYSSGSTVVSLSILARVLHDIDDVHAFLSNKTSLAKLRMMRFFGLNISLFGGPSQPEPIDPRGGIQRAQKLGEESETIYNPNQYENEANPEAHIKWTGPQILRQLPNINVLAAGLGTSGTMTGIGTYLKQEKPSCHIVGVCTAPGDRVPGPRSYALLAPVKFRWRETVDTIEEVGSPDSYRLSMMLSREGLICGPSSGFNLQGLYNFLAKRKEAGTLEELAAEDGQIHCVFICCDLPYQYLNEYFEKLGEEHFHPIQNEELVDVDLYRYDEAWELDASTALLKLYGQREESSSGSDSEDSGVDDLGPTLRLQKNVMLLDLRPESEFSSWHLPGSVSLPLASVAAASESPFKNPKTLREQWTELEGIFKPSGSPYAAALVAGLKGRSVGLLCRDGDTARVATSVLRQKGVEAFSIAGGVDKVGPLLLLDQKP